MTDESGVKYVDTFGRSITAMEEDGELVFYRKGKRIPHADVNTLLKELNSGTISYKEFETELERSKVCTVFSKDVQIEQFNVEQAHNVKANNMKGFNMAKSFRKMFDSAGDYVVKINSAGKQIVMDIKLLSDSL